jgi:Transmembrane secretion effector
VTRFARDFRLLFASQAASLLGDGMINVALAFAVLEVGGSASSVGLVFALRTLPLLGSLLVGGVVADRMSRRAVMIGADVLRLAAQGTMAVLLIAGVAEVWSLAVLAGVGGAALGFYAPAATGLLPEVVAADDVQRANGLRLTAMAVGEIAGPLVAGGLVVVAGAGFAIAIDAATFAVSAALLARMSARPARPRAEGERFLHDLRDGWRAVRSRTWIWTTIASSSVANMVWGVWTALGPVVAARELGGAGAWGAVLAAMGAGGLAGGVLAIRRPSRRPLVVFALTGMVMATPLALLAEASPVAVIAAAALVAGGAMTFGNAVFESTLQLEVPADALSRVSAYEWFGSTGLRPVGLAVWGPIAVGIGFTETLWVAFALMIVTCAAPLAVREVRTLGT